MSEGRYLVCVPGRGFGGSRGAQWRGLGGGVIAGQVGMGLGGDPAGMVVGRPVLARVLGKN
jgi:hypothetical protein